jgi:hypothetical protein
MPGRPVLVRPGGTGEPGIDGGVRTIGRMSLPDVSRCIFEEDGTPVDMESYLGELFRPEAVDRVRKLRDAIIKDLEGCGITVISDQEADQAVPWLEPGEDLMQTIFDMDAPITVKDAFFFLMP